jgi:hypothetical protein
MASSQNPFANWSAGNGYSSGGSWNQDSAPPPSIVGALPYPHPPSYPLPPDELITFTFTSFNPTILNCTVLGPQNRPYFYVVTDASMPGYTLWKNAERKNIALVEWQNTPLLEARGILAKQQITNWLRLAPDRRFVDLAVFCMTYEDLISTISQPQGSGSSRKSVHMGALGQIHLCKDVGSSYSANAAHPTYSFTQQVLQHRTL